MQVRMCVACAARSVARSTASCRATRPVSLFYPSVCVFADAAFVPLCFAPCRHYRLGLHLLPCTQPNTIRPYRKKNKKARASEAMGFMGGHPVFPFGRLKFARHHVAKGQRYFFFAEIHTGGGWREACVVVGPSHRRGRGKRRRVPLRGLGHLPPRPTAGLTQ